MRVRNLPLIEINKMNYLIHKFAESGMSSTMYGYVNAVATYIALLCALLLGWRMGVKLWKQVILLAGVYFGMSGALGVIWSLVTYAEQEHFLGITSPVNSIVRVFAFVPLIVLPFALILKVKWSLACDAIVMYPLVRSCLAQIACIFPGCCRGYVWEHGIYNVKTECNHFPTQIVETVLTLLIIIYLLSVIKGKKYVSDGSLYPYMMILYGIMRFACEMLRDNEKILFGISAVAIHAILIFAVGIIWMLILYRYKENNYEDSIQTLEAAEGETLQAGEGTEGAEA